MSAVLSITSTWTAPQGDTRTPKAFQSTIITNLCRALQNQPRPPCLLRSPTGSGKTFMLTRVLRLHQSTYYGKVLFLTKDASRFRIVNDDGSIADVVDFDNLSRLKSWMRNTQPAAQRNVSV